LTDNSESL